MDAPLDLNPCKQFFYKVNNNVKSSCTTKKNSQGKSHWFFLFKFFWPSANSFDKCIKIVWSRLSLELGLHLQKHFLVVMECLNLRNFDLSHVFLSIYYHFCNNIDFMGFHQSSIRVHDAKLVSTWSKNKICTNTSQLLIFKTYHSVLFEISPF